MALVRAPIEGGPRKSFPGPPFFEVKMATYPDEPDPKRIKREIRVAVENCHELIGQLRHKLKQTGQDNDPE
jgi:hypothetical protein